MEEKILGRVLQWKAPRQRERSVQIDRRCVPGDTDLNQNLYRVTPEPNLEQKTAQKTQISSVPNGTELILNWVL